MDDAAPPLDEAIKACTREDLRRAAGVLSDYSLRLVPSFAALDLDDPRDEVKAAFADSTWRVARALETYEQHASGEAQINELLDDLETGPASEIDELRDLETRTAAEWRLLADRRRETRDRLAAQPSAPQIILDHAEALTLKAEAGAAWQAHRALNERWKLPDNDDEKDTR